MNLTDVDLLRKTVDDIQFEDIFDLNEIQLLQDLFSETNGVASIITQPDGTPITQPSNFCNLCKNIIRETEKGRANCFKSDAVLGKQSTSGPIIKPCLSAGLIDAGASISIDGKHIANWLIGQVRTKELDEKRLIQYADEIGADKEAYIKAAKEVPIISEEQFRKISNLLFVFAKELSDKAYANWQLKKQMAELKKKTALLQESEFFFKASQKAAMVGSFKVDFIMGHFVSSEVLNQILGVEKNRKLSISDWTDIIHPVDREMLSKYWREEILTKQELLSKEYRIVRPSDNETRWVLGLGNAGFNSEGVIVSFTGTLQDITDRKLTELLLQEKTSEIEAQNEEYKQINEELHVANNNLEISEATYKMLFESINDAVFILELSGEQQQFKFVNVNQIACRRLGYSREELLSMSIGDVNSEKTKPLVSGRIGEIMQKGHLVLEAEHVTKDGKIIPVEVSSKLFYLNGKTYIHSIARDITKRVLAEALNNMLKHSLDVYTDGIYWMNSDNVFVYVNDAGGKAFGCKPEDLLGKSLYDVNPTTTPESLAILWNELRTKGSFTAETVHRRADGSEFYVEIRSVYLQYQGNEYNNGYARDITERKLIEKELIKAKEKAEESERFLHVSQKIGKVGSYVTEFPEGIWRISPEMYDILGITPEYPRTPQGFLELVHPDSRAAFESYYTNVIVERKRFDYMYKIIRFNDKVERWVHGFGEFLYDSNDKFIKQIGTIQDITDRKLVEEELVKAKERAEESDRLKTAFLHNLSHEIRTPMNAIMGFSELLVKSYGKKDKLEYYSGIIGQRCGDLLTIIDDVLHIAKIESGQLHTKIEKINLGSFLKDLNFLFAEHQLKLQKKNLKFMLKPQQTDSNIEIVTDKGKLKQIFVNLIGNAFKFTDEGEIEVGCDLNNNQQLVFFVSDTGIGIPSDKHEFIFERFAQLEATPGRLYGGTGLGLSIVKGLIDSLGGKIWLKSVPQKGTTFYFTIPCDIEEPMPQVQLPVVKQVVFNFAGKTMLIVEDDKFNAAYLKEVLEATNIHIIHTIYGNEAIQIANSQTLDIVLMDIRLPDTNGYIATQTILQNKPNLKIIAQTAYATNDDKEKALAVGCIDYISKPAKKEALLALINKYL